MPNEETRHASARGNYYNRALERLIEDGPESSLVTTNKHALGQVIWSEEGPFTVVHCGVQFTGSDGRRWQEFWLRRGKIKKITK